MKLARVALAVIAACSVVIGATAARTSAAGVDDAAITADAYPAALSEYGFFADLRARTPAARVTPYTLNTPLFSDYAEKQRFLYLPAGAQARYDPDAVLDLPVGAALIKTFGYRPDGVFRALETRVLLHRANGWVALPYVWNADGSDATLRRAGARLPVTFTDPAGVPHTISYQVPNQNQCKDCHALSGSITPIGPKVRNLNDGHQLQAWAAAGLLDRLPADAPRLARWDDPAAPLGDRATAYLETNCAHCHNARGAASNSGLFFDWRQLDATARGIGKHPVAAGRGSGGRLVDIAPGQPDASILVYRMESVEPGIAMPELGRNVVHAEGVALIRQWIAAGAPPPR
ncbi:SO2930 family diheme c-type cytochrome [Sphingomonas sp.]|uniref:SO2930 family diheme c-type cytochrome n=1 Tax=Sphingomonas sp. TaxID=28214 RepID=UPI003CC6618B